MSRILPRAARARESSPCAFHDDENQTEARPPAAEISATRLRDDAGSAPSPDGKPPGPVLGFQRAHEEDSPTLRQNAVEARIQFSRRAALRRDYGAAGSRPDLRLTEPTAGDRRGDAATRAWAGGR